MNLATSKNMAIYRSKLSRWSPMLPSRSRRVPVFRRCDFLRALADHLDLLQRSVSGYYRHHHGQSVGWLSFVLDLAASNNKNQSVGTDNSWPPC